MRAQAVIFLGLVKTLTVVPPTTYANPLSDSPGSSQGVITLQFLAPSSTPAFSPPLPRATHLSELELSLGWSMGTGTSPWHAPMSRTFLRLFPDYSVSTGAACALPSADISTLLKREIIFYRIGDGAQVITIEFLDDPRPNAFALGAAFENTQTPRILVTRGLLRHLHSESQMAFILAHEMAHIELGHFAPALPMMFLSGDQLNHIAAVHERWEEEADRFAQKRLSEFGFALEHVTALFESLREYEQPLQHGQTVNHPPLTTRIAALTKRKELKVLDRIE